MSCPTCNDVTPLVFNVQSFINQTCNDCGDTQCLSSKYVCYQGSDLPCSGILTGDTLETALTKIDEQICSASGDYSTYQMNCLPAYYGSDITTEAEFVDAITSYTCAIATNLQSFTGTTFPQYQSDVAAQFSTIDGPGLTCATAGVTSLDSLSTILTKYCAKFVDLDTEMNLSDINFASCFSVVGTPTTLHEGFTEVLSQICQVKTLAEGNAVLPTFNNTGLCIGGGSTDSLVTTINAIITRLCQTDVFVPGDITWGCITTPADLQEAVANIASSTNTLLLNRLTGFSADFVITATDGGDPCAGKTISLATPIVSDRFVASTPSDTSPGTLSQKLQGDGIEIDTTGNPPYTVLRDLGGVKTDGTDTLGYLKDKLAGSTVNGITITPTYNSTTKQIDLILSVDETAFCAAISACLPVACASYLITPSGSDTIYYTDCSTNTVVSLTISGPVTVCAAVGSVNAPNSTIINEGNCTTTTTTTSSTTTTTTAIPPVTDPFLAQNNSTALVISSITDGISQFFVIGSGSFPLTPGGSAISGGGTTSSAVNVTVSSGDGIAKLYKNLALQETINLTTTGTFAFAPVVYSSGDSMIVIFEDTP